MNMVNEKTFFETDIFENDNIDFNELERKLYEGIDQDLKDLEILEEEKEKLENPEVLGTIIKDVVWEQFTNQIGITAGKKVADEAHNVLNTDIIRDAQRNAREEYAKLKAAAEKCPISKGKKSCKNEINPREGENVRVIIMKLLAELIKEITSKLIAWFKSSTKKLETLKAALKEAILSFISKLRTHLISAGATVFSTVFKTIIGPIFRTISKVWRLLKQGWVSLQDAIRYIQDPANKGKPVDILIMEVGKIIIAGLTGVTAIALGEVIEKNLMTIPFFAFEIPLLGSLANILGTFLGAVTAGIIGAIALNMIDKVISRKKRDRLQLAIAMQSNIVIRGQTIKTLNKLESTFRGVGRVTEETINSFQEAEMRESESFNEVEKAFEELERLLG